MQPGTRLLLLLSLLVPLPALAAGPARTVHMTHARQRAQAEFHTLQARAPTAEAEWRAGQPGVHMLLGLDEVVPGVTAEQRAEQFLRTHEALIGVALSELRPLDSSTMRKRQVVRYQQIAHLAAGQAPVNVYNSEVTVTFDSENGHLLRIVSDAMPTAGVKRGKVTREEAIAAAQLAVYGANGGRAEHPVVDDAVVASGLMPVHVWIVHLPGKTLADLHSVMVDATTGRVARLPSRVLN
jgi:hypothetical protein